MLSSCFRIFGLVSAGLLPLPLLAQNSGNAATMAAATASAPALNSAGSIAQVMLGLAVVLALMFVVAWIMKRMGVARTGNTQAVRVVGGTSVGHRERVVVVEIGAQWIVVGVAPGRVNALATLPRETDPGSLTSAAAPAKSFASWLHAKKGSLEKSAPGTAGAPGTSHE